MVKLNWQFGERGKRKVVAGKNTIKGDRVKQLERRLVAEKKKAARGVESRRNIVKARGEHES